MGGFLNRDGSIDGADLGITATHVGSAGPTPVAGDVNGDGIVDALDLALVPLNGSYGIVFTPERDRQLPSNSQDSQRVGRRANYP